MNEWETCIDEWAERLREAQATIADPRGQIAVERANKESAVACVDRDVKKISALQQRVAQLRESEKAAEQLLGSFFEALKPLKLTALNVQDPGQHVRDLVTAHTTLRGLVEKVTKMLTELMIIPVGCSREQELSWKKAVKDLRAAALPREGGAQETKNG